MTPPLFFTRVLLRSGVALTAAFAVGISLIHAPPVDDAAVRAFLTPPEGCPLPCWQGIRLGETTIEEAVRVLEAHPWVAQYDFINGNVIDITEWSGEQPSFLSSPARLMFSESGKAISVMIPTTLAAGDVHLLLGAPPAADVIPYPLAADRTRRVHVLNIYYTHSFYLASDPIPCPLHRDDFWTSPVTIEFNDAIADYGGLRAWDRRLWSRCP